MKKLAKIISVCLAICLFGATIFTSAIAEENTVAYKFNSLDRNYGYGGCPQTAEYTDGGYVTISDSGRFLRQQILYFPHLSSREEKILSSAIMTVANRYNNQMSMDVKVNKCSTLADPIIENSRCEIAAEIQYRYLNPEGSENEYATGDFYGSGWVNCGTQATIKIDVSQYKNVYAKTGFEITAVEI